MFRCSSCIGVGFVDLGTSWLASVRTCDSMLYFLRLGCFGVLHVGLLGVDAKMSGSRLVWDGSWVVVVGVASVMLKNGSLYSGIDAN